MHTSHRNLSAVRHIVPSAHHLVHVRASAGQKVVGNPEAAYQIPCPAREVRKVPEEIHQVPEVGPNIPYRAQVRKVDIHCRSPLVEDNLGPCIRIRWELVPVQWLEEVFRSRPEVLGRGRAALRKDPCWDRSALRVVGVQQLVLRTEAVEKKS